MAPAPPAPPRSRPATIEVIIETLTGSGFRLRVSSFETVMSVKARVQRIEGVPISQQHLIFHDRELADSASLLECGVVGGCRLTLVVAMRGGPVNTRRLPLYEDMTRAEMHQLIQMQSEAPADADARSGRQVTLLVFREGDQVNFYRVMENTDGTFSPLSDSWGSSIRNMFDEESPDELKRKSDENSATMNKVTDLKQRMQRMALRKKGRRRTPRAGSERERVRLPPVSGSVPVPVAPAASSLPHQTADLSRSFSRLAAGSASRSQPPALSPRPAGPLASARVPSATSELAEERQQLASRGTLTSGRQLTSGRRRKLSLSESTELFRQVQAQRGLERRAAERGSTRDYGAYRRTLAKLALNKHASQPTEPATPPLPELPVLFETDERRGGGAARRVAASAGGRPRSSPHARQYAKDDNERCVSPTLSLRPTDSRARQLCRILSARASLAGTVSAPATAAAAPVPPAVAPRPRRPRCRLCRRRLALAATYTCHCSQLFCAQHRYPESHQCGHDFKTEGRKLLERANPLVTAPKLPKI